MTLATLQAFAVVTAVLGSGLFSLRDWSLQHLLTCHYAEIDFVIYTWDIEKVNYQVTNATTVWEMDVHQVVIGGIGCVLDFAFLYTHYVIKCVLLFSSMTVNKLMRQFVAQLSHSSNFNLEAVEESYQMLLQITKEIDAAFGNLFIIVHVDNLVLTQNVIRNILYGEDTLPTLVMASQTAIVYLSYYHGVCSASKV